MYYSIVKSMSASARHIGGPIYVKPGKLALIYGKGQLQMYSKVLKGSHARTCTIPFSFTPRALDLKEF